MSKTLSGYVLTNYTVQCTDQVSGAVGCFLFDVERYTKTGLFFAVSQVFASLDALYAGTLPRERKSVYAVRD